MTCDIVLQLRVMNCLYELAKIQGYSNIKTTERYVKPGNTLPEPQHGAGTLEVV